MFADCLASIPGEKPVFIPILSASPLTPSHVQSYLDPVLRPFSPF